MAFFNFSNAREKKEQVLANINLENFNEANNPKSSLLMTGTQSIDNQWKDDVNFKLNKISDNVGNTRNVQNL